jgi:hypothetical protein
MNEEPREERSPIGDRASTGPEGPDQMREPTEEELLEALRQLRVEDVLLQTVVTLVNLAGRKLTVAEELDLPQAKLAIDAVRQLLPLCPQEQVGPIQEALTQLQMAYVKATEQPGAEQPAAAQPESEPEPPKPESKIWTPPGT